MTASYEQQIVLRIWVSAQLLQGKPNLSHIRGSVWHSGHRKEITPIRGTAFNVQLLIGPSSSSSAEMGVSGGCGWKISLGVI